MVSSVPEEHFVICSSSEGTEITEICATDRNRTRRLCCHHDYRFPHYYDYLVDTLKHTKSLKIQYHPRENVTYCCDIILVYVECLESDGAFNPEYLDYIIHIFEDTSDYRFCLWATQKYKKVVEFIKKNCVRDEYVMPHDDIITYGSLFQEAMREYCQIVDSRQW